MNREPTFIESFQGISFKMIMAAGSIAIISIALCGWIPEIGV